MNQANGHRLRAGSLLESVLALTLIAGALGAAVALHAQVLGSDKALERISAWSAVQSALEEPWPATGGHKVEPVAGWPVEGTVTAIGPGLVRIDLVCTRHRKPVLHHSVIRPVP
jgi:hypothetical protein